MAHGPTRNEQILTLWDEGLSAAQIAVALGEGLTRNAAIGVVHRAGRSRKHVRGKPRPLARNPQRPPKPRKRPPLKELKAAGPVRDFPARGRCRYIAAEEVRRDDWRCCGHETGSAEESWCAYHRARVFRPPGSVEP